MKKLFLLLSLACISYEAFSQMAISYYPITSYIGVSTNPGRRLWGDLRLQTNTFIGFSTIEVSPKLNWKRTDMVKGYAGLGANLNIAQGSYNNRYINGYFLSGGIMVSPFKELRGLSFIFEISPYMNYSFSDGIIRTTLGLGYQFTRRKHRMKNSASAAGTP